ncbi:MAG TPA: OsmC family protein [Pontimonas sp.]|nr:OsmC family protein [Pontimonas sp.]
MVSTGLGACTSMAFRMHAEHKQIPLEHISVVVLHDKRRAEEDPEAPGTHDHCVRKISLAGDLSPEQRASL